MAIEHQPPRWFQTGKREPVNFLAGPIQGAPDWQAVASEQIKQFIPGRGWHIANPRRPFLDPLFDYDHQVRWEKRYLKRAARCGSLIFWFAAQDETQPYPKERVYAKTTHKEFHRAIGWLDFDSAVKLSIGIEPAYLEDPRNDTNYLLHTIREFPSLRIHDTLEETVDHALRHSF